MKEERSRVMPCDTLCCIRHREAQLRCGPYSLDHLNQKDPNLNTTRQEVSPVFVRVYRRIRYCLLLFANDRFSNSSSDHFGLTRIVPLNLPGEVDEDL